MKKRLLVLLLVLITISSIFAQGKKDERKVVLWHSFKGVKQEALNLLINEYNEKNEIKIEAIFQGKTTDLNTKLRASMVSGDNMPNIAQLDASAIYDVINSDYLIPASTLLDSDKEFTREHLLQSTLDSQEYKDKILGLPFNASTMVLYYNKTIFDSLKLNPPKTFDELARVSQIIKKEKDIYGISNTFTTYEMVSMIGQQNGYTPITNNNNGHQGTATKVLFDTNNTMANILRAYQKIYSTGGLHLVSSSSSVKEFLTQKTAMILGSTSKLTTLEKSAADTFEVGVSYLPKINEAATGGVNVSGGALYAFKGKDSLMDKESWKVMKFLTSAKSQLKFHQITGYFPVNKETYKLEEFIKLTKKRPNLSVAINQLQESNPKVVSVWWHNSYPIYMDISSMTKMAIEENTDPDIFAKKLSTKINGYIK